VEGVDHWTNFKKGDKTDHSHDKEISVFCNEHSSVLQSVDCLVVFKYENEPFSFHF
jgi:hypothetical protein